MNFVPSEVETAGVYWPPLLFAATLGAIAMVLTVRVLIRFRLTRFLIFPEVVMLALVSIYTVIFGTFVFPL